MASRSPLQYSYPTTALSAEKGEGDGEIRLNEITVDDLRHLRLKRFQVYGARVDGETLELVHDEPVKHRSSRGQSTNGISDDDRPFSAEFGQTLVVCPTPSWQPSDDDGSVPTVDEDVRMFFAKNVAAKPLQLDGYRKNLWEFDDVIFHMPYYTLEEEPHSCSDEAHGRRLCFFKKATASPGQKFKWDQFAHRSSGKKRKLCFVQKAVTICVYDHKSTGKKRAHKHALSLGTRWSALVIDPDSIFKKEHLDGAFLSGHLPASARNKLKKLNNDEWRENQNADFFQTRLIEVGLKHVLGQWRKNMDKIEEECKNLERELEVGMDKPSYWRRDVNDTLLMAYKISKNLDILEHSIEDIIGLENWNVPDNGVWKKFRTARPRKRMGDLEDMERSANTRRREESGTRSEFALKKTKTEHNRLKHLLWELCDIHRNGLFSIQSSLTAKKESMDSLRQLLVDLSQTRASLYANQLGDHVKGLTYVSIVFLPLGYCASLWSMNYDLHSKLAFIISTCVTSFLTLALLGVLIFKYREESLNH